LLRRGYVDLVPPQQEKIFEKFDRRGDGKEGQMSRMQQSTTQVNSITREEGARGSRRMAMAVGEVKLRGEGAGRKATYAGRWGQ